jgi:hypothetical protein
MLAQSSSKDMLNCLINKVLCLEDIKGRMDVYSHVFLISALAGGEYSTSNPSWFNPQGKSPNIQWTGEWLHSRISLDDVERRKIFPYKDSNSTIRMSSPQ